MENYTVLKTELGCLYEHIAERRKIRRRCQGYEDGKKSTKSFLNLVKAKATKSTVKMLEKTVKKI